MNGVKILMFILGCGWLSLHMAAGVLNVIFMFVVTGVRQAGPVLWTVPGVCLVLLVLDWSDRIRLSGTLGKFLTALTFPVLCGVIDVLLRDRLVDPAPPVRVCVLSLLVLAGYVLLIEEREKDPLDRAAALLDQGGQLTLAEAAWLYLIGSMIFLLLLLGSVITLFLGLILASKNDLLDYAGIQGMLIGWLGLHLLQSVLFLRGTWLARRTDPALDNGVPLVTLFFPIWNQMQATKLEMQLKLWGAKDCY